MKKAYLFFAVAAFGFTLLLLTVFLFRNTPGSPLYAGIHIDKVLEEGPIANDQMIDGKVNINTAECATLAQLPGIGETLAQNIVNYREKYGPFQSIFELKEVEGIGQSKFRQIQDFITIGGTK